MNHAIRCFTPIAIMLLLLCTALPAMAGPDTAAKPAPRAALQGTININTADAAQLTMLPGIGPKTAESIVAYRNSAGPFSTVDDMVKVKGIGRKTLDAIRPFLSLEGETTLSKARQG